MRQLRGNGGNRDALQLEEKLLPKIDLVITFDRLDRWSGWSALERIFRGSQSAKRVGPKGPIDLRQWKKAPGSRSRLYAPDASEEGREGEWCHWPARQMRQIVKWVNELAELEQTWRYCAVTFSTTALSVVACFENRASAWCSEGRTMVLAFINLLWLL